MKNIKLLIVAMVVAATAFGASDALAQGRTIGQLAGDIAGSESAIKEREDALKDLEKQIKEHKDAIKDLEKQKKQIENEIKQLNSTRKSTVAVHDNKLFDERIGVVLTVPYSKSKVDEALKNFDDMENKDVLKKKNLVKNYGSYTKDLKQFLTRQMAELDRDGWKDHGAGTEAYKEFEKGLKGTKYYKVYKKRGDDNSIPYLDGVMDKVVRFQSTGLSNKHALSEIISMLND